MNLAPDNHAHALKAFLCQPENRTRFLNFYKASFICCRGYLRYLRGKGWNLPLEQRTDINPVDDLAIDILGKLFRCDREKPFHVIFDYFCAQGIIEFGSADPDDLLYRFLALLRSFTRQELGRLKKGTDPQIAKLKKRFTDILSGRDYLRFKDEGSSTEYICFRQFCDDSRRQTKPVTRKLLEEIVTRSLMCTKKETNLCRDLFIRLNDLSEYQNRIPYWELLTVLVAVRATYAEEGFPLPGRFKTPIEELAKKEIDKAKSRALDRILDSDIKRFVDKKRISEQEGRHLLRGCSLYLEDLCNGGHTDLIPCYFREVMPEIPQQRYLSNYKYLFETIISRAVAYLREDMVDNPIIRQIESY